MQRLVRTGVLGKIDAGLAALDQAMPEIAGTLAYLIPHV